jgi:hypothetical protein
MTDIQTVFPDAFVQNTARLTAIHCLACAAACEYTLRLKKYSIHTSYACRRVSGVDWEESWYTEQLMA